MALACRKAWVVVALACIEALVVVVLAYILVVVAAVFFSSSSVREGCLLNDRSCPRASG